MNKKTLTFYENADLEEKLMDISVFSALHGIRIAEVLVSEDQFLALCLSLKSEANSCVVLMGPQGRIYVHKEKQIYLE
jgi:hypothetical protein